MTQRIVTLIALLFVSATAFAADPVAPNRAVAAKPEAARTVGAGKSEPAPRTTTSTKADARSAAAPAKVASGSQQNRMRECNKSATGKRGQERKEFMRSCLSSRKG